MYLKCIILSVGGAPFPLKLLTNVINERRAGFACKGYENATCKLTNNLATLIRGFANNIIINLT
jgi:hypothetical protein